MVFVTLVLEFVYLTSIITDCYTATEQSMAANKRLNVEIPELQAMVILESDSRHVLAFLQSH
jgi:hypothetical protein